MTPKIIHKLDPLHPARFLSRPNRFLLQVRLEDTGQAVHAHMADPGRLRELLVPGKKVWIRPETNPARKTRWTALLVENPDGVGLVSIDTFLPNRLIGHALRRNALPELTGWTLSRTEVPMGRSRFDFLLTSERGRRMALEVKSVSLVEEGIALFPDAVTARGARHLEELAGIAAEEGWEAGVMFLLQRDDARKIRAAARIDPKFASSLEEAHSAGVRILGRRCKVFLDRIELADVVPVEVG